MYYPCNAHGLWVKLYPQLQPPIIPNHMPAVPSRILLVSANKVTHPYPVFPLGLAFLEAALKAAGHEVRIHDQLMHPDKDLAGNLAWAECVGLSLRNVDNVSATAPVSYLEGYRDLLRSIRRRTRLPLIAGGPAFSIFPVEFMQSLDLEFGISGEAEEAIVKWVRALKGQGRMEDVPGLLWRTGDGNVRHNPPAAIEPKALPSPRPDPEWIRSYLKAGGMLNAQTQRGCAFHCTYCTYPWIEGRRYRHREPDTVVAELRHLHDAGARYVFLADSVFNTSRHHVEAICNKILDTGLRIQWGCFARPANLDGGLLDLMIRTGLRHIEFGSDSFCDATLESYGKSFRFDEILEVSRMVARRRVHACHYIIFGGPGESEDTIRETIANARHLPDAPIFAFSGMRIYPHTPLHRQSGDPRTPAELLEPAYYSPPGLEDETRERLVREGTRDNPNWFLSDHADNNAALIARLRRKGKQGPLWEYLVVSRRLWQEIHPPTDQP